MSSKTIRSHRRLGSVLKEAIFGLALPLNGKVMSDDSVTRGLCQRIKEDHGVSILPMAVRRLLQDQKKGEEVSRRRARGPFNTTKHKGVLIRAY